MVSCRTCAATPYSVTTYCTMVRGADTALPAGMQGTMLDFRVPSFRLWVAFRQMKPLPPRER